MEIRIIPIYHFNPSTKHPTFQIPVFIRSPHRHRSNGRKNAKRRKNRQNQVCIKVIEKSLTHFEVIYFEKSELTPDHKNGIHLWQFLLSLLRQPKFEKHIKWIDQGRGKWEQSEVIMFYYVIVLKVLTVWTIAYL